MYYGYGFKGSERKSPQVASSARIKPLPHSARHDLANLRKLDTHGIAAPVQFFCPRPKASTAVEHFVPSVPGEWCFQHRVGGMQLEESDMTCQVTWSSSRTPRAARRDSVVAGGHRTATAAAGLKDTASIATVLSPHAGRRRVNGQGHGRAPDHGLSSSMYRL